MTGEGEHRMEEALRAMSTWDDPSPRTWERALEVREKPTGNGSGTARESFWERPIRGRWVSVAAVVALCVIVGAMMMPSLGTARGTSPKLAAEAERRSAELMSKQVDAPQLFADFPEMQPAVSGRLAADGDWNMLESIEKSLKQAAANVHMETQRLVERKATIELEVDDTRAAYVKARAFISQARGEFVQGGRIDDQSGHPRADLTLRVQADRLDEVLDDLRRLGKVKDERLDAADVTDQMVDIEARLANERRIEAELIELLDKRPNDKLEDILRVRKELSDVRGQIERMQASRDRLASLVALATVTVVIAEKPEEPKPAPEEQGLWGSFVEDLATAWHNGVANLLGFVVWLTAVIVGGLPFWLLAGFASAWGWRSYRRTHPKPLPV